MVLFPDGLPFMVGFNPEVKEQQNCRCPSLSRRFEPLAIATHLNPRLQRYPETERSLTPASQDQES